MDGVSYPQFLISDEIIQVPPPQNDTVPSLQPFFHFLHNHIPPSAPPLLSLPPWTPSSSTSHSPASNFPLNPLSLNSPLQFSIFISISAAPSNLSPPTLSTSPSLNKPSNQMTSRKTTNPTARSTESSAVAPWPTLPEWSI